jgi:antibiotic biosynthesis monooxygenase (ABM) superfamily enzyme
MCRGCGSEAHLAVRTEDIVMLVIVFRSRLKPGLRDEYVALVDRVAELARTMPGYISHEGFLHRETGECRASRGFQEVI